MFDQSFKGVDTKLLSLLALLSNKTNEMQLTASFENEYRRHSLYPTITHLKLSHIFVKILHNY
jgi:hypothetical protein